MLLLDLTVTTNAIRQRWIHSFVILTQQQHTQQVPLTLTTHRSSSSLSSWLTVGSSLAYLTHSATDLFIQSLKSPICSDVNKATGARSRSVASIHFWRGRNFYRVDYRIQIKKTFSPLYFYWGGGDRPPPSPWDWRHWPRSRSGRARSRPRTWASIKAKAKNLALRPRPRPNITDWSGNL